MAQYRLSVNVIGRSSGRSATAAAAYRAASRIVDQRTGLVHDYRRKEGVEHTAILTPEGAPEWMRDRDKLWNAVEAVERRGDAQLVREIQLSLPHDLTHEQRVGLVTRFIEEQFVQRGMVADLAVHAPSPHEYADERNHHAHVMLTMRELLGEGFGKKNREWNERAVLEEWRQEWAEHQNREFERLGLDIRVNHRSLADQGILRQPQHHMGPIATEIERDGRDSYRGNENREIRRRNGLLADLEKSGNVLDAKIEFEKRKFEAWGERKRQKLQIDKEQRDAQFQVGLAARMAELDAQLEAEFGTEKQGLTRAQEQAASRLEVKGWRKFIRDITLTTRRDRQEVDRLENQMAALRRAENLRRQERQADEERRRRVRLETEALKARKLDEAIAKARERREQEGWARAAKDAQKQAAQQKYPLKPQFDEAVKGPQKAVERDQASGGGSAGKAPKTPEQRAEAFLQRMRDKEQAQAADQTTRQREDMAEEAQAKYRKDRDEAAKKALDLSPTPQPAYEPDPAQDTGKGADTAEDIGVSEGGDLSADDGGISQ